MFAGPQRIDPNKVAIYVRWSTEEQGEGTTLDVQRDSCKHFIYSQGWAFREDLVFVDEGWSGSTLDRPAMTRLREAVKRGEVGCVVVYKLDRLSRNLLDCVGLVRREWEKAPLYSTKENFDTHSPVGQMLFNILVSFAEFERTTIRDRMMGGKMQRAKEGRWLGSRAAYGYQVEQGEIGGKTISQLVPDPDTAPIVRQLFIWSKSGTPSLTIARKLNDSGTLSPSGGKWRVQTVLWILKNPIYKGTVVFGRESSNPTFVSEEITAEGTHEPLVDADLFDAVQKGLAARGKAAPRTITSDYLFSGTLVCSGCGATMTGDRWWWEDRQGTKKHVKIYRCRTRNESGTCTPVKVKESDVEAMFLSEVEALAMPGRLRELIERDVTSKRVHIEAARAMRKQAEQRVAEIVRALAKLEKTFLESDAYTPAQYKTTRDAYLVEKSNLELQLAEPMPTDEPRDFGDLVAVAKDIRRLWQTVAEPQEQKAFVRDWLEAWNLRLVFNGDERRAALVHPEG